MSGNTLRQKGGSIDAIRIIRALGECNDVELCGKCKINGDLVFVDHITSKININDCIFLGTVDFANAIFSQDVCFSGCHFSNDVKFPNVDFMERAHFDFTIFRKNADFDFAKFRKDVSFKGARFAATWKIQIISFNYVTFYGEAEFAQISFESNYQIAMGEIKNTHVLINRILKSPELSLPWWWYQKKDPISSFVKSKSPPEADVLLKNGENNLIDLLNKLISGPSLFEEQCFKNIASENTKRSILKNSRRTRYHNRLLLADAYPKFIRDIILIEIRFMEAKFHGHTNFSGSKFIRADFRGTMFYDKTMFCYCEFEENANFKGATFDRNSIFYQSVFFGDAIYSGAIFEKETKWSKSRFVSNLFLNNAKICSMQFNRTEFDPESRIMLNGSYFDLFIISWNVLKDHLFIGPEMDAIYLSLIKSFKELGWWKDADDCSFQYNLYKNKSELVKALTQKQYLSYSIFKLKLNLPKLIDIAAWLCGYGIKIEYLLMPILLIILVSGLFFNMANHQTESIINSLENSTLLFLSGSLGNLSAPYSYVAACENFFRTLVFGVFVVLLTRKLFR